jgi:FeS assembly SUF system protein
MNQQRVFLQTTKSQETEMTTPDDAPLRDKIIAAIRTVYDPEIPVNIYDLGLIYDIAISEDNNVDIKMTLTAPGCPVAGILPGQVENAVRTIEQVNDARVEIVWDPPWTQDRMTDEARLELGMF